jgi:hypothetical protein
MIKTLKFCKLQVCQNYQKIERTGTAAVKQLRRQKLLKGLPFMINSKELPSNQCYLEYPDGTIQLVSLSKTARDFDLIRELSLRESKKLRLKFNLATDNA